MHEYIERNACISSLYVCMAIKHIIVLFVETPRKFITTKLSIRKPGSSSVLLLLHIISTDEDPGLRIESFAVINLRGISTNKTIKCMYSFNAHMATFRSQPLNSLCEICKPPEDSFIGNLGVRITIHFVLTIYMMSSTP